MGCLKTPGFLAGRYLEFTANDATGVITLDYTGPAGGGSGGGSGDYVLPIASASTLGGVKIGNNVQKAGDGTISVNDGSFTQKGVVQIGQSLDINTGKVEVPIASDTRAGIVKIGDNIFENTDGTISIPIVMAGPVTVAERAVTVPPGAKTGYGVVAVGDNIDVNNGVISVPIASATVRGVVRAGKNIIIDEDGIINAEIPDLPAGEGDTVLQGTGIYVLKDAQARTAEISLSQDTQDTLAKVATLETDVSNLQTGQADHESRITALETDQAAQDTAISTLQTSQTAQNNDITALKSDVAALQTSQSTQDTDINALKSDVATIQTKQTAQDTAISTNAADISTLKTDVAGKVDQTAYSNDLTTINNNFTSVTNSINQLQTDITAAQNSADDKLPLAGGEMTGNIDTQGNKVTGLPTPGADTDAATKKYVDDSVSSVSVPDLSSLGTNINLTSGATITNVPNPQQDSWAASKGYVDQEVAKCLPLDGGSMTGTINMNNYSITQLVDPIMPDDAATKKYVDNAVAAIDVSGYLPITGGTLTGNLVVSQNSDITTDKVKYRTEDTTTENVLMFMGRSDFISVYPSKKSYGVLEQSTILRGLKNPEQDNDAATKQYVDNAIATINAMLANYLPLAGGTMTGNIDMGG